MSSTDASWETLDSLFTNSHGNFDKILGYSNGIKYLKLRTISKGDRIKQFARNQQIQGYSQLRVNDLLEKIFTDATENDIEDFIKETFVQERDIGIGQEDELYEQLSKVITVDWGGVRNNRLERSLVDNYVKRIKNYDKIKEKLSSEVNETVEGWILSNWYSFWSNKIIENLIKDHSRVLPGIGDIKHIDFFWDNIPFDLKTTKFARGFIDFKRQEMGIGKEVQALKRFARDNNIDFDNNNGDEQIKTDLILKFSESNEEQHKNFVKEQIYDIRKNLLDAAIANPEEYAIWNYENQGEDRFGDENRFFLILVDKNTTEESWKLKRERGFITQKINEFLDRGAEAHLMKNLSFTFGRRNFVANCCILFILEE